MRIYISIPISGLPIEQQNAKANDIADKLRKLGHEPVNPFDTIDPPSGLREDERYAYYMGEAIKKLLMCDAIFFCERWYQSKGCRLEANAAILNGLQEYDRFEDVPKANGHE